MTMLSTDLPEYQSASIRFITEVTNGLLSTDPLFAGIERSVSVHRGPIRNVPGGNPLDQGMFQASGEATLPWDSVRNGRIDDYINFLIDLSDSQRRSLAKRFFAHISEITDATGMTVNGKGKPLTGDMILDLLEKIEFGFDDDGNPEYPTLILPPALVERLKTLKPTPEQEERHRRIIEEKRAKFNASKRTRRLSR